MGYFSDISRTRISRRRVLRGGALAASGLAGAALIGCGGGSSTPTPAATTAATSSAGGAATAAATQAPTTAAAAGTPQKGGTYRYPTTANADSLDANTSASYKSDYPDGFVYQRMVQYKRGDGQAADGTVVGDAVETWEQPDDTTVLFHLRQNIKFDPRPPTNGHPLTSEDVIQSFNSFAGGSPYRGDLVNSVNPNAPVTKWEAVDDHTVKFTLAFPDASLFPALGWTEDYWVQPVEAVNGGFDAKSDMRGSGPFILEEFKSGVSYTYKRNPDWYGGPDRPYIDGVQAAVLADAAQIEAQLKAGNFDWDGNLIPLPDIPSLAKSTPSLQVMTASPTATGVWGFNYGATDVWNDERVRQAISMSIDRDALATVRFSPDKLAAVGVKTRIYWMSPLSPGEGKQWLDPSSADFGPNVKYLQHNVAEATKLLSAAGYSNSKPFEFELEITPQYWSADWDVQAQTIQAMLADSGIKMAIYNTPYTSDWVPNYLRGKAKFKGHKMVPGAAQFTGSGKADATQSYEIYYSSWGANTAVGTYVPDLDKMITDAKKTLDDQARLQKTNDIARWMTQHMPVIPVGVAIDNVGLASKKLHGPNRYQSWPGGFGGAGMPTEVFPDYWFEA